MQAQAAAANTNNTQRVHQPRQPFRVAIKARLAITTPIPTKVRGSKIGRLSSRGSPWDRATITITASVPLPTDLADSFLATVQHATIGDLSPYGLSSPPAGVIAQLRERGAGTAVVDKEVIDAIRDGGIRIVAAVDGLDEQGAQLVDGSHVGADVVIAATGYTTGLREMAGHLDVLDARGLPRVVDGGEVMTGLRFVGYVLRPGLTGYTGKLARVAARGIAASRDDTAAVAS